MNLQKDNGVYMKRIFLVGTAVASASYFIWSVWRYFNKLRRINTSDNNKNDNVASNTIDVGDDKLKQNESNVTSSAKEEYVDFQKIKLIYKEMTVFTIDCIMQTIKDLERNKDVVNQGQSRIYKENVITSLDGVFEKILEKNELNVATFMKSLKYYCENDKQFKLKVSYVSKVRRSFIENENLILEFPKEIKDNFLKIVTNIFYLTGYAAYKDFKEIIHTEQIKEKNVSDRLYQKYLKATRKKVYAFFGVPKLKEINVKYLVRLFPFSLRTDDPVKVAYMSDSQKINEYLDNLSKKIIPSSFLEMEQHEELTVVDVNF